VDTCLCASMSDLFPTNAMMTSALAAPAPLSSVTQYFAFSKLDCDRKSQRKREANGDKKANKNQVKRTRE
jgi:hypothetical protein